MSGRVGSAISESGVVENVGVTVEIEPSSLSVQNLFDSSVLAVAKLNIPLPVFAESDINRSKEIADSQSEPTGNEISLLPHLEA